MTRRSQFHKLEVENYRPPITAINPDTASIPAAGAVNRVIASMDTDGGSKPITYTVTNAGGLSLNVQNNELRTNADPVGTVGLHTVTILATGVLGMSLSETIAVTVT